MVAGIITIVAQVLGWLIERGKVRTETARQFFRWAETLGADVGSSKLRNYATRQQEWMNKTPWVESK